MKSDFATYKLSDGSVDKVAVMKDVTNADNAIFSIIGKKPKFFRFPYFSSNAKLESILAKDLGKVYIVKKNSFFLFFSYTVCSFNFVDYLQS